MLSDVKIFLIFLLTFKKSQEEFRGIHWNPKEKEEKARASGKCNTLCVLLQRCFHRWFPSLCTHASPHVIGGISFPSLWIWAGFGRAETDVLRPMYHDGHDTVPYGYGSCLKNRTSRFHFLSLGRQPWCKKSNYLRPSWCQKPQASRVEWPCDSTGLASCFRHPSSDSRHVSKKAFVKVPAQVYTTCTQPDCRIVRNNKLF